MVKLVSPRVARWFEARKLRKFNRPPPLSPPVKFSSDLIELADDN